MGSPLLNLLFTSLHCVARYNTTALGYVRSFNDDFIVRYGNDRFVSYLSQGEEEIQLSMDNSSGAGLKSKQGYGSGFFSVRIKLPEQHSPGVVTTFYLTSNPDNEPGNHDELDFEFLGSDGLPYVLQTNVFANDSGGREQRLYLWFDPTKDFHEYGILWNHHQVVFSVDAVPIRVYKNRRRFGARYPTQKMFVDASIWNGESWASGGRRVNWSVAPFLVKFNGFRIDGCPYGGKCWSPTPRFWWNWKNHWDITPIQLRAYAQVRKKYLFYDYCRVDNFRTFPECHVR